MKKELWLRDQRRAIGANPMAVHTSCEEWFHAALIGRRSRKAVGKEVGYRHKVRQVPHPTYTIDLLPLLIVV